MHLPHKVRRPKQPPSLRHPLGQVSTALITALLASVPLLQLPSWGPHDLQRVVQIACLLAIGTCWSISVLKRPNSKYALLPFAALSIWFAFATTSVVLSANPQAALQDLSLLVCCLATVEAIRQRQILTAEEWIGRGTVVGAGAYAAVSVLIFVGAVSSASALLLPALVIGFDNYRFLNHAQTVILPLVVVVAISDPGIRWRRSAWLVLIVHFALLALTRGRATAISLIIATLVIAYVIRSPGSRQLARALGLSAVGGVLLYGALYLALPRLLGASWGESAAPLTDVASGQERLVLWQAALGAIQQSPWFGIGPMHFAALHMPMGAHPHNIYLQWMAEYGLPAGLAMSATLFWVLYRIARRLRDERDTPVLATAAWTACMSAAIDGLFSGNFVMPLSQCWIALAFGLMLRMTSPPPAPTAGPYRVTVVAAALVFFIALGASTLQDAAKDPPHVGKVLHQSDAGMPVNPRFWLNGRI